MGVDSRLSRLTISKMCKRCIFSTISRATCTLKHQERNALSAIPGYTRRLFSKVFFLSFAFFAFVTHNISDLDGKLEGESIVGECIESTVDFWYREELSPLYSRYGDTSTSLPVSRPASHPNSSVSHWRELVLQKWDGYHLRITTKPENLDGWVRHDEDSRFFDPFVLTPQ
jgi:hypothetical protein